MPDLMIGNQKLELRDVDIGKDDNETDIKAKIDNAINKLPGKPSVTPQMRDAIYNTVFK